MKTEDTKVNLFLQTVWVISQRKCLLLHKFRLAAWLVSGFWDLMKATYMSLSWLLLARWARRSQWSPSGRPRSPHSSSSCCIAADQAAALGDCASIQVRRVTSRPYLEGAAGAGLAQPDDAVQIVGGDGLVLLLDETERREVESGLLALSVFQHGGELIDGAPCSGRQTSWAPHVHIHDSVPVEAEGEKELVIYEGRLAEAVGSQLMLDLVRGFVDLRDKKIKEGGVGGMRVHRGITSVQEHKVPGEKEWGPQHRVRDSRSQVESSNFTIYQDRAMRLETKGEIDTQKNKVGRSSIHFGHPPWTWIYQTAQIQQRKRHWLPQHWVGTQVYFISNKISILHIWQVNNLCYKFLLQLQLFF